eukprot:4080435-Pyramimonas_sp.AAC.2
MGARLRLWRRRGPARGLRRRRAEVVPRFDGEALAAQPHVPGDVPSLGRGVHLPGQRWGWRGGSPGLPI